jgi:hypothetical protein
MGVRFRGRATPAVEVNLKNSTQALCRANIFDVTQVDFAAIISVSNHEEACFDTRTHRSD